MGGDTGGISLLFLAPTQKGKLKIPYKSPIVPKNHSDLKQKYDLQIIKQKLNSTQLHQLPSPPVVSCWFPVPHTSNHSHNSSAKLKAFGVETSLPRSQSTFTPEKKVTQKIQGGPKNQL